jgi:hypothetical protein
MTYKPNLTASLLSLTLIGAGCSALDKSGYSEFFPPDDANRRVNQFVDVQANNGAQEDATLNAIHFDGPRLNSLGVEKLWRMIPDDGAADMTVYLNLPDDSMSAARKADVLAYLNETGMDSAHVKIQAGANPATHSPAQQGLLDLAKLDAASGDQSTSSSSGGSSSGGNSMK